MPINSRHVLVVGGAGFIGSHMLFCLRQHGFTPVVLDNLSTGNAHAVYDNELIIGDAGDKNLLKQVFSAYNFIAVMHFASLIDVNDSVKNPIRYYQNNVIASLNLLETAIKHQVRHFIFSSSASVYGEPLYTPIDEKHVLNPLSPYGRTKWMVEEIIKDYAASHEFSYAILRYFNAAGADPEKRIGERHSPETHLIPRALQAAVGETDEFIVYGNDYATHDGTCVRDYIHVNDICDAHILALFALLNGRKAMVYNLGAERGYSVAEALEITKKVTQQDIKIVYSNRRAGDPAILVADASLIKKELNWQPRLSQLETIITHAWAYMQSLL